MSPVNSTGDGVSPACQPSPTIPVRVRHLTNPFIPLDLTVDEEEWYGPGLCCPDDPLDSLEIYVDDGLLESLAFSPVAGHGNAAVDHVPGFSPTVRDSSVTASAEAPCSPYDSSTVTTRRRRRGLVVAVNRSHVWSASLPSIFVKSGVGKVISRGKGKQRRPPELSKQGLPRQRNRRRVDRRCAHCAVEETPQWRMGPGGPGTLCNACGIRYSMGKDKLVPEYRPSTSPSFRSDEHSNRDRKVGIIRQRKKKKKTRFLKLEDDDDDDDGHSGGGELLISDYTDR